MGALQALHDTYRDRVEFLVVYIREAHPDDGWVVTHNRDEGIRVVDPATADERAEVAATCTTRAALRMPVVVDGIDDAVAGAYGAWPDRLYLIDRGGRIAFLGGPGPFGFLPDALAGAIEATLKAA